MCRLLSKATIPRDTRTARRYATWLLEKAERYPHPVVTGMRPRPDKVNEKMEPFVRAPFKATRQRVGVAIWLFETPEKRDAFTERYPNSIPVECIE